jgi:hypothetical protein
MEPWKIPLLYLGMPPPRSGVVEIARTDTRGGVRRPARPRTGPARHALSGCDPWQAGTIECPVSSATLQLSGRHAACSQIDNYYLDAPWTRATASRWPGPMACMPAQVHKQVQGVQREAQVLTITVQERVGPWVTPASAARNSSTCACSATICFLV